MTREKDLVSPRIYEIRYQIKTPNGVWGDMQGGVNDELTEYRGKWANLYLFSTGSTIGIKRFNSAGECVPGTMHMGTGQRRTVAEAIKAAGTWGNFEWKDFLFVLPIPVRS